MPCSGGLPFGHADGQSDPRPPLATPTTRHSSIAAHLNVALHTARSNDRAKCHSPRLGGRAVAILGGGMPVLLLHPHDPTDLIMAPAPPHPTSFAMPTQCRCCCYLADLRAPTATDSGARGPRHGPRNRAVKVAVIGGGGDAGDAAAGAALARQCCLRRSQGLAMTKSDKKRTSTEGASNRAESRPGGAGPSGVAATV
jgi:hypothetical protein